MVPVNSITGPANKPSQSYVDGKLKKLSLLEGGEQKMNKMSTKNAVAGRG